MVVPYLYFEPKMFGSNHKSSGDVGGTKEIHDAGWQKTFLSEEAL